MHEDLPILASLSATPWRFLWNATSRTAILADLHLGAEESLAGHGIYLPEVGTAALRNRWEMLLARQPAHIVIAGDLFDSPQPSPRTVDLCRELLATAPCPITLIPGNHDPDEETLRQLLPAPTITIATLLQTGNLIISHGHNLTLEEAGTYGKDVWIVGHQHPALTLATRVQSAKFPCFAHARLSTNQKPHHLLILPAFSSLPLGSHLLTESHWILPLDRPANYHIQIFGLVESRATEPQVLHFGPLSLHV